MISAFYIVVSINAAGCEDGADGAGVVGPPGPAGATGATGPAGPAGSPGEGLDGTVASDVSFTGAVTTEGDLRVDGTLEGDAVDDLLWTINHATAAGVCGSLDRTFTAFTLAKVVLPNSGPSCTAVCQAFATSTPDGSDTGSCVAQVAIRPTRGRVTAPNQPVARHETSGCAANTAGRGSAESELAEVDPEGATAFNYCCCSLDQIP